MSEYVEAPNSYGGDGPVLFLAGGITNCPDWQETAYELLRDMRGAVVNPRRQNFPMLDPEAAAGQIAWEYGYLQRADVVLFWFAAGPSVQPIALYELGFHAATGKPIAVGAEPGYLRHADVVLQLGNVRPELTVYDALPDVCAEARRLLAR